jgi:hypothetical protein
MTQKRAARAGVALSGDYTSRHATLARVSRADGILLWRGLGGERAHEGDRGERERRPEVAARAICFASSVLAACSSVYGVSSTAPP